MTRSRLSLKRTLLYSTFAAVALLSASALAQDDSTTTSSRAATTTTTANSQTTTTTSKATSATSQAEDSSSSAAESSTTTGTGRTTAVITATGSSSDSESITSLPTISGSSSSSGTDATATDMPTLSTTAGTSVPSYPAPTVPPTENAPFMRHSKAPTGTVFIAVGAILGAIFLAVLLWRAVVAWLLHRSVARAALAQHLANDKATFAAPAAPFYKYSDRDSTHNLAGTTATNSSGRGVRRTKREPIPSATPSQTNLFFSPTAAAGAGGTGAGGGGGGMPGDRASRLLPSGFYVAGASNIGGNGGGSGNYGNSINMTTLRPESRGLSHATGSPPDSPAFGPRTSTPNLRTSTPNLRNASGSSLNYRERPQSGQSQRPPSAFLDDLLDDQQDAMHDHYGGQYNSNSHSSRGRY